MLLALALVSVKQGNKTANRLFAALVFAAAISISGGVIRTTGHVFLFPHLSRVHDPFPFLAGPLLYLYLRTLTQKTKLRKRDFLHFIPFGICVLYLLPYFFQSTQQKLDSLYTEYFVNTDMGEWYYVRSAILILHVLVYLALIIWTSFKYLRQVKEKSIQADKSVLFQLRYLVITFVLLWIFGVLRYTLDHTAQGNLLIHIGVSVMIYGLGYICLTKPEIVKGEKELPPEPPPAPKYEKSTLLPERAERYLKKLQQVMETEKPYLDGELTLQKLAEKLSIPPHHLSQIINERLNQSFSDFVNSYRVEEVKKRLLDPAKKHYSILAIAEEVGFNSKSSFNAVFKKHANVTPSEFRKASNGSGKH